MYGKNNYESILLSSLQMKSQWHYHSNETSSAQYLHSTINTFLLFEKKEEIYFFGKFFTLVIIRRERVKNEHYTFAFKLKCQKCITLTRDQTRGKNSTTKYYNAAFVLTFEHP